MAAMSNTDSSYRIGAVSRLTGVPADTLRVWERRYAVVEPRRTEGGSRLYSQHDVARLGLIKKLVDAGHAIGTVANLTLEQLGARAASAQAARAERARPAEGPLRLVLLGTTLPLRLAAELRDLDDSALTLAGSFLERSEFEAAARTLAADVLVVEQPTLGEEEVDAVRRLQRLCDARRVVVVYGFAQRPALARLEEQGVTALRFPVSWDELRRVCVPEPAPAAPLPGAREPDDTLGVPPPRRFDDRQLALVSATSTTIKCECPHHLADLITSMARFEQYSAECENRSREDAALHAYLHRVTGRARSLLEDALQKLVEVEGIDLGH